MIIETYGVLDYIDKYRRSPNRYRKAKDSLSTLHQKVPYFSGGVDIINKYPLITKNK